MNIFKDKLLISFYSTGVFLLLISLLLIFINFSGIDLSVYLITRYSSDRGIGSFGNIFSILGLWFSAFLIVILNFIISCSLFYKKRGLAILFGFISLFLSLLILIQIGAIISIN